MKTSSLPVELFGFAIPVKLSVKFTFSNNLTIYTHPHSKTAPSIRLNSCIARSFNLLDTLFPLPGRKEAGTLHAFIPNLKSIEAGWIRSFSIPFSLVITFLLINSKIS